MPSASDCSRCGTRGSVFDDGDEFVCARCGVVNTKIVTDGAGATTMAMPWGTLGTRPTTVEENRETKYPGLSNPNTMYSNQVTGPILNMQRKVKNLCSYFGLKSTVENQTLLLFHKLLRSGIKDTTEVTGITYDTFIAYAFVCATRMHGRLFSLQEIAKAMTGKDNGKGRVSILLPKKMLVLAEVFPMPPPPESSAWLKLAVRRLCSTDKLQLAIVPEVMRFATQGLESLEANGCDRRTRAGIILYWACLQVHMKHRPTQANIAAVLGLAEFTIREKFNQVKLEDGRRLRNRDLSGKGHISHDRRDSP